MQSLTYSMQMTIPAKLNVWYMLLEFVMVMLACQIARLLNKNEISRIR